MSRSKQAPPQRAQVGAPCSSAFGRSSSADPLVRILRCTPMSTGNIRTACRRLLPPVNGAHGARGVMEAFSIAEGSAESPTSHRGLGWRVAQPVTVRTSATETPYQGGLANSGRGLAAPIPHSLRARFDKSAERCYSLFGYFWRTGAPDRPRKWRPSSRATVADASLETNPWIERP